MNPELAGKRFVVTGGNTGIGLATAAALCRRGAQVLIACRSEQRAAQAIAAIKARQARADLAAVTLDLASLACVRDCAAKLNARLPGLDGLINNAGVMMAPQARTEDGFELQFGTNVLGHFALTGLLLPLLAGASGSRVVTVSSLGHWFGKLDFDNLAAEKGYHRMAVYAQTKLANLVFAQELQRRLQGAGMEVISVGVHPGVTISDLARHAGWVDFVTRLYGQSSDEGARPSLMAATDPRVKGGDYVGPGGFLTFKGPPTIQRSRRLARDPALGRRLWQACEDMTGVRYLNQTETAYSSGRNSPGSGEIRA